MEKITFDANENQNRAGVDILMTEKIHFNFKNFNKRQRRFLCNDKGVSSSRGNNKYIHVPRAEKEIKVIQIRKKK